MDFSQYTQENQRVIQGMKDTLKALINKFGGTVDAEKIDQYPTLVDGIEVKGDAGDITYDNAESGLHSSNVQDAIDELSRDQKQIIPPKQVPGYTSIVSSSAMGQQSYGKTLSLDNIQGNTVLGGTPAYNAPVSMESVEGPLKLRVAGKNLVRPAWNLESQTQTGVTCTRTGNSFTLAGTNSGSGGVNFYIQRYDTASAFSLPAGTYTLSGMPARAENKSFLLGLYHRLPGGTNEQLATDYGNPSRSKQTFTLGEATDSLFLVIVVGAGVNADGVTVTPQIEAGSEATAYEEPSNAIVEIPLIGTDGQLLEPLRMSYVGYAPDKTPNPDRIIRKNGIWYVERTTAQLDLTNATWVKGSSYFAIKMDGKAILGAQSRFVLCTHFPGSGEMPDSAGIWCGSGLALQNTAVPADTTNEWMAEFCAEQAQAGTPVTVVYSLPEPIYEELHQDVQNILNTLTVPIGVCSVWFEGEVAPTADIGIPRGDFPSENARALAMTRADRTLSNLTDYQKALRNIGGRPNRNWLINPVAIGGGDPGKLPINQKGLKTYTNAIGENTIDGWKLSGDGLQRLYIETDGLLLTSSGQYKSYWRQIVDPDNLVQLLGKEVTLSFYLKNDTGYAPACYAYRNNEYFASVGAKVDDITSITFTIPEDTTSFYIQVGSYGAGTVKFVAAKLEESPIQTLGWKDTAGKVNLFETPNYCEELARCQQYQLALRQYFISPAVHFSADYIDFSVPTPIEMRTVPAIEADGISIISDGKGNQTGFTLSVVAKLSNAVRIRATKTGHGLSFTDSVRFEVTGERAMLNANM